jgi:hypothetical protein
MRCGDAQPNPIIVGEHSGLEGRQRVAQTLYLRRRENIRKTSHNPRHANQYYLHSWDSSILDVINRQV